jgi:hypothetical protein
MYAMTTTSLHIHQKMLLVESTSSDSGQCHVATENCAASGLVTSVAQHLLTKTAPHERVYAPLASCSIKSRVQGTIIMATTNRPCSAALHLHRILPAYGVAGPSQPASQCI